MTIFLKIRQASGLKRQDLARKFKATGTRIANYELGYRFPEDCDILLKYLELSRANGMSLTMESIIANKKPANRRSTGKRVR